MTVTCAAANKIDVFRATYIKAKIAISIVNVWSLKKEDTENKLL